MVRYLQRPSRIRRDLLNIDSDRLGTFAAAANGRATKIIIPSELQGLAGLATGILEAVKAPEKPAAPASAKKE